MDFFGPFEVKHGRATVKRYGVVFTCLNVRAVHIEVAQTLNTDSCINAIRRFVARRGPIKVMRSDNGTNFVRAECKLREAVQNLNNTQIQTTLLSKGICWLFNPQIRTIRRILSALMHQQMLDEEGLNTLLCEVEAIINDRPITNASNDPLDFWNPLHRIISYCLKQSPSYHQERSVQTTAIAKGDGVKFNTWQIYSGKGGLRYTYQSYKNDKSGQEKQGTSSKETLFLLLMIEPQETCGLWAKSYKPYQIPGDQVPSSDQDQYPLQAHHQICPTPGGSIWSLNTHTSSWTVF